MQTRRPQRPLHVSARPTIIYRAGVTQPESDTETDVWLPASTRSSRRWSFVWLMVGGLLGLAPVALLVLTIGLYIFVQSDRLLPGVSAWGIPLGGQTRVEAEATLNERWQQQAIVLDGNQATWPVLPDELGMTLDPTATVAQAYEIGRSLDGVATIVRNGGRLDLPPVWRFDPDVAHRYLEAHAAELAVAPVDAGLQVVVEEGGTLRVVATPAIPGQALDVEATMARLVANPAAVLANGRLEPATIPVQPAVTDVGDAVAQANQFLSLTLTMHAYDPVTDETLTWSAPPEVWSQWVSLAATPERTLHWSLKPGQVETFLAAQPVGEERYLQPAEAETAVVRALTTQTPDVRLRLYHRARQHVVQPGETLAAIGRDYGIPYPWIQQANPGADALHPGQTITIPSPDELLPLPVVENKRVVVSISRQRVWVYENGGLKWEWPVSTGIDSSPTAPGVFQIQSHEPNAYASIWDLWMPNFMGVYRPVPTSDFMNGFHGFPTRSGSQLLWTNSLGSKVTYGCILLSNENVIQLYHWAENGVVVEIQP